MPHEFAVRFLKLLVGEESSSRVLSLFFFLVLRIGSSFVLLFVLLGRRLRVIVLSLLIKW